jgi:hypothetical protein
MLPLKTQYISLCHMRRTWLRVRPCLPIVSWLTAFYILSCVATIPDSKLAEIRDTPPVLLSNDLFDLGDDQLQQSRLIATPLTPTARIEAAAFLQGYLELAEEAAQSDTLHRLLPDLMRTETKNISIVVSDDKFDVKSNCGPQELDFSENVFRKMYEVGLSKHLPAEGPGAFKNPRTGQPVTPREFLVMANSSAHQIYLNAHEVLVGAVPESKSEQATNLMWVEEFVPPMTLDIERSILFVLAHELFHLRYDGCTISADSEIKADIFAACVWSQISASTGASEITPVVDLNPSAISGISREFQAEAALQTIQAIYSDNYFQEPHGVYLSMEDRSATIEMLLDSPDLGPLWKANQLVPKQGLVAYGAPTEQEIKGAHSGEMIKCTSSADCDIKWKRAGHWLKQRSGVTPGIGGSAGGGPSLELDGDGPPNSHVHYFIQRTCSGRGCLISIQVANTASCRTDLKTYVACHRRQLEDSTSFWNDLVEGTQKSTERE